MKLIDKLNNKCEIVLKDLLHYRHLVLTTAILCGIVLLGLKIYIEVV